MIFVIAGLASGVLLMGLSAASAIREPSAESYFMSFMVGGILAYLALWELL